MDAKIRPAVPADVPVLHALIERAYRGDAARAGWTHEADLLTTPRTDRATLHELVTHSAGVMLAAEAGGVILGCVQIGGNGDRATLGMLTVDPGRQAGGLGRQLLAAAEDYARTVLAAELMELTVVSKRAELIAWYERRGYRATGEERPFPVTVDPPLRFVVMTRPLVHPPTT